MKKTKIPNKPDIEQAVLSGIISNPESLEPVLSILKPEYFFDVQNRAIFEAMLKLNAEGIGIDSLTLVDRLKKDNALKDAGGLEHISIVASEVILGKNIEYYSRVLTENWIARKIISGLEQITNRLASDSSQALDALTEAKQVLDKVEAGLDSIESDERPLSDRIDDIFEDVAKRREGEKYGNALKLNTFPSLNKSIGGIMPTDLIGIYGREKSTKTTLAHEIAMDVGVDQKLPVMIFSFEDSKTERDWKSISLRTGLEFNKLRNPQGTGRGDELTLAEMQGAWRRAKKTFAGSKLFIIDAVLNETQIYNKVKRYKAKHGIRLVVIDYLMLLESHQKYDTRREELNALTRFFKRMAQKLEIPIILISQSNEDTSRAAEAKGLERDSNYFITLYKAEELKMIKLSDPEIGEYNYSFGPNEYLVQFRAARHTKGGRVFVTKYNVDGRYIEVDTRPGSMRQAI